MQVVLDIDLDFFVSPIKNWHASADRLPEEDYSVDANAKSFFEWQCRFNRDTRIPGACFEEHDELFDFGIANFRTPIHLIHVDAHADIGGGFSAGWHYVGTEYLHLDEPARKHPQRGPNALNAGNFIIFLAACRLLREVTFVSHVNWHDDYGSAYMQHFDPHSEALQLKRFDPGALQGVLGLQHVPHQNEAPIPFRRTSRADFQLRAIPDLMFLTRSPGYTPQSADTLYDDIAEYILPPN
jgi:hypothetical protein